MRDNLTSKYGDFKKSSIEYLEGCHQDSFQDGPHAKVESRVQPLPNPNVRDAKLDPIINIPQSHPDECELHKSPTGHTQCQQCQKILKWDKHFESTVDEIVYRFNRHDCSKGWCKMLRIKPCINPSQYGRQSGKR